MFGTPRRDPIGHDNYASQAQYAPPLMFSKRNERIDWRRIGLKNYFLHGKQIFIIAHLNICFCFS